jgi:hypothetical protein
MYIPSSTHQYGVSMLQIYIMLDACNYYLGFIVYLFTQLKYYSAPQS